MIPTLWPRSGHGSTRAGLIFLTGLVGCGGDSALPTEPDPCPANLALMVGHWTGMAGNVRVTMSLAPKKVPVFKSSLDAMSGRGMADPPDENRDVPVSFQFICELGLISAIEADVPPAQAGAPPSGQVYTVGYLEVQSITANRLVAVLTPVSPGMNLPYPFEAQVQIEFGRPPA
jgi:hypothetical protein